MQIVFRNSTGVPLLSRLVAFILVLRPWSRIIHYSNLIIWKHFDSRWYSVQPAVQPLLHLLRGIKLLLDGGFLPIITAMRSWPIEQDEVKLGAFKASLAEIGYTHPRMKLLPSLKIGQEVLRDLGYSEHDYLSKSMMVGYDSSQLICSYSRIVSARGKRLYCVGDLGAFGPFPDRACQVLRETGIPVIQGNYDNSIGSGLGDCQCGYTDPRDNHFVKVSYDYTFRHTSNDNKNWLQHLSPEIRIQLGPYRVLLCLEYGPRFRTNEGPLSPSKRYLR